MESDPLPQPLPDVSVWLRDLARDLPAREAATARAFADYLMPPLGDPGSVSRRSFETAAEPLIRWLCENCPHPHYVVHVTQTGAELLTGEGTHRTTAFLKD